MCFCSALLASAKYLKDPAKIRKILRIKFGREPNVIRIYFNANVTRETSNLQLKWLYEVLGTYLAEICTDYGNIFRVADLVKLRMRDIFMPPVLTYPPFYNTAYNGYNPIPRHYYGQTEKGRQTISEIEESRKVIVFGQGSQQIFSETRTQSGHWRLATLDLFYMEFSLQFA